MSAAAAFKQADMERLFSAAVKAGLRPTRAMLTRDGVELLFDPASNVFRGGVELD